MGDVLKQGLDEGLKPGLDALTKMQRDQDREKYGDEEGECVDGVMVGGPKDGEPCEKIETSDNDDGGNTTSGSGGTSTTDTNGGASIGIKPDGTWPTGKKYAMAKWGSDLDQMAKMRDEMTPNSDEYNDMQNKINESLGNKTRH
jgi:hypothetical protein